MAMANQSKEQLSVLNKEINEEKAKVESHKATVEEQLRDVMPEVEKAQSLVKKIDSGALAEITVYFRSNSGLPSVVYYNLKAMLQLIGYNDLNQTEIKSTFNMKTILALQNFNIKNLTKENAAKIQKIVDDNEINKLISNEQMTHQNSIKFSVKSLNDSDDEDFKGIMSDVKSSFENEKKYLIVISEKYNDVTDNDLYDIINNPDKYLDFAKLYTIY